MSGAGQPPGRVPTLTEVVFLSEDAATAPMPLGPVVEADVMGAGGMPPAPPAPALNEDLIVQRVLADLQRQIDLMLEYRMREVLKPILTRATDAVIRETRSELASTLRDVVARAVAQELARHRTR